MALNWSFKARLYNASDAMKKRYATVCDELRTFAGVKTSESWDKVRVYIGRKTYATMFFRGKTLCLTLALAPSNFADTKFICEDVSDVERFAATPLLTRMTSDRQVKYLAELLSILFENLEKVSVEPVKADLPFYTQEELIKMKLIKVYGGKKGAEQKEIQVVEQSAATATVVEEELIEVPQPEVAAAVSLPEKTEVVVQPKIEPVSQPQQKPVEKPKPQVAQTARKPILQSTEAPAHKTTHRSAKGRTVINVGVLNANFDEGSRVTLTSLKQKGLAGARVISFKVLGGGQITKPLTLEANGFSRSAAEKIQAAGGTVTHN